MDYFCEKCDKYIKPESKYKHFKSNTRKEFDKYKHVILTNKKPDINDIDEIFYAWVFERNKKNVMNHLMKCEFNLVFNDNHFCPYVSSELYSNKTMCYWYKYVEKVISDFKDKGYSFSHIVEMNIITSDNKLDLSYEFYIKRRMRSGMEIERYGK